MQLAFAPHEAADLPVDSQKRVSTPATVGLRHYHYLHRAADCLSLIIGCT
jgi:hypothetical protein